MFKCASSVAKYSKRERSKLLVSTVHLLVLESRNKLSKLFCNLVTATFKKDLRDDESDWKPKENNDGYQMYSFKWHSKNRLSTGTVSTD